MCSGVFTVSEERYTIHSRIVRTVLGKEMRRSKLINSRGVMIFVFFRIPEVFLIARDEVIGSRGVSTVQFEQ
jgi:hypothetical protein